MRHIFLSATMVFLQLGVSADVGQTQQSPPSVQKRPLDPAVKRDGWWIRVDRKSQADKITWRFTQPTEGKGEPMSITWQRANDPESFDLPEAVRLMKSLRFEVTAEPANVPATFCLFHAAEGVQLVEFSTSAKTAVDLRGRDKQCRP